MTQIIQHLLYTNLAAGGEAQWRLVPPHAELLAPPKDINRDRIVRRLIPDANHPVSPAFASFSFARDPFHVAVVIQHLHESVDPALRRGGVLNHVVSVPYPEGSSGSPIYALLCHLRAIEIEEPLDLEHYMERNVIPMELDSTLVPPDPLALLSPEEIYSFAEVTHENESPRPATFLMELEADNYGKAAEKLAVLSGLIPPRMRLSLCWCAGMDSNSEVGLFARLTSARSSHSPRSGDPRPAVKRYTDWLVEACEAKRGDEIRGVTENWDIRSWRDLELHLRQTQSLRAGPGPPARKAPPQSARPPKAGPGTERGEIRGGGGSSVHPETPAEARALEITAHAMEGELLAMQRSLHEFVERRMDRLEPGLRRWPPPFERTDLYFLITVVLIMGTWIWLALAGPRPAVEPEDPGLAGETDPFGTASPDELGERSTRDGDEDAPFIDTTPEGPFRPAAPTWADEWRHRFANDQEVVRSWLAAVVAIEPEGRISGLQAQRLRRLSDALPEGKREIALTALFHFAMLESGYVQKRQGRSGTFQVNLLEHHLDASAIEDLIAFLQVDPAPEVPNDAETYPEDVKAAVVLGYFHRNPPGPAGQ